MKRHPKDQAVMLQHHVDELIQLHVKMEELKEHIADAYAASAMHLDIKAVTLKKVVKQFTSPEEPADPALAQLMAMLEPEKEA
jgi:hypothetical protein